MTEGRDLDRGTIDVVGYRADFAKLDAQRLTNHHGAAAARRGSSDPTAGATDAEWNVWTKYDAVPDDDKEQYTEQYERLVADHPEIVAQRVTGTTYGGRDIVALQVTKDATGSDIPGRPAVLYNAMQHAREWLAGETCRRTLDYFVGHYGKGTSAGKEATKLVDNTELWFVCVNNPDGYEYTFTPGHRLWRKNLADNDNNNVIDQNDGVDPNRNFSSNWGRDRRRQFARPRLGDLSWPESSLGTRDSGDGGALRRDQPGLPKERPHGGLAPPLPAGRPAGHTERRPRDLHRARRRPVQPAIPGFIPELSAALYITNGDFTDWAYNTQDTLSFTPEGTPAEDVSVSGFEYPDSPLQIQQEFERHLPFALDLAHSADDPANPHSHLDNKASDFTVDKFKESYGSPQPVGAVVKRELGKVKMKYRVEDKKTKTTNAEDYEGGERYYQEDGVYHRVRGVVKGTKPGDEVEVWFTAGGEKSKSFSYEAEVESGNPVLILSNEDYSGVQPIPRP